MVLRESYSVKQNGRMPGRDVPLRFDAIRDLRDQRTERIFREWSGLHMSTDRLKRITVEEGKCGGRPCIRGQRIRVTDILELFANGASFDEILVDYAFLEREDIYAAIEYAAHQADHTVLQTL